MAEQKALQFVRGGFVLTVNASDVTEVLYSCPQCGTKTGITGLSDACRKKWLPRR